MIAYTCSRDSRPHLSRVPEFTSSGEFSSNRGKIYICVVPCDLLAADVLNHEVLINGQSFYVNELEILCAKPTKFLQTGQKVGLFVKV